MNDWHIFPGTAELDRALAKYLAGRLQTDIECHGHASLAVSGGGTPRGMFRRLSSCELDWNRVWLTLVDERQVATDSPASNERMLREHLLQNRAAAAHFVSLADNGTGGLEALGRALGAIPRPFSAVVLGMGDDGHTASWFPGAANLPALLDPANPADVAETTPVTAPHRRLTLTLAAVTRSREILVHITGEAKKTLLENARADQHPVAAILQQTVTPASIWWAPQ
ncbi:MAG: 6-phosphogluconolactonase [Halieaceae bacterium]|jgi:6-phosphogluconolactonase|nr:6-phosphogluconolactonase [Halieaceae bacterium]